MIVKLLWFAFLILFNVTVAPLSAITRWCKEVLFGSPIISDNGLPLLTENIFQTSPHPLFGPPVYWYLGYLSDPPPFIKTPTYYLELESTLMDYIESQKGKKKKKRKFHSHALTGWVIWPWIQLAVRPNFVQLLQFHLFVQWLCFISVFAFVICHICFKRALAQVIILVLEWIHTYGIHHWMIF